MSVRGPFPHFWRNPVQYCRWAAHEKPAIWYSILIGATGLSILLIGPPIKRAYGWEPTERTPMTYPIPKGPRKIPEGFDDPK